MTATVAAFSEFEFNPRWVGWRNEPRADDSTKLTKKPFCPHTGKPAEADNPGTWGSRSSAEVWAKKHVNGQGGGVGLELGDLGNGWSLGGIDLDTCFADGKWTSWAVQVIKTCGSYTEVSPSGAGAKIFFKYRTDHLLELRAHMGTAKYSKVFARRTGVEHPPAIEVHLGNRYFAVTEQHLEWTPDRLVEVGLDTLLWLLTIAGPAFSATKPSGSAGDAEDRFRTNSGPNDKSRSAAAFRKGCDLRRAGKNFEQMVEALRNDSETAAWCREKADTDGGRQYRRIWEKAEAAEAAAGVTLTDFHAYMPMHNYIFVPTRALWPAASVNARIPPLRVGTDKDGEPIAIKASTWIDQNQPVEQMTWAPGLPEIIEGRLLYEGGWIDRPGVRCFNQYLAPSIVPGASSRADRWLDHVRIVYPGDADYIINWLAFRVQYPEIKINHAIVLGGNPGIGKDSILTPVRHAIGPWNFREATPTQILGKFTAFLKAVILRVNEAHDLGEFDRFALYDHMKSYIAAPPEVLTVNEKNVREYAILNICGVVITTNHKSDGIYLPAEDRRHYVAWSDLTKEDEHFTDGYWDKLYSYFEDDGGNEAVTAHLQQLDISGFDSKAPPPKTPAFWAIVDANRSPEEPELADIIDQMNNPDALTLGQIIFRAEGEFADWLKERRNRRIIPHRLETCGYVPVRNPDDVRDGHWRINSKRQTVYARQTLSLRDQIAAAQKLR